MVLHYPSCESASYKKGDVTQLVYYWFQAIWASNYK